MLRFDLNSSLISNFELLIFNIIINDKNVKYSTIISLHKNLYTFGENNIRNFTKKRIFLSTLGIIFAFSFTINTNFSYYQANNYENLEGDNKSTLKFFNNDFRF